MTVLSRCLQFTLRPMAPETVREHLTRVLQAEAVGVDPQAMRLLARAARGSMRDALSLTDQAIAFGGGQLSEASVRQMLGSVDRSYVFRLLTALADADGKAVVEIVEQLRIHGLNPASMLEEVSAVLQRMAVLQAVPDLPDELDPDARDTADLAARMPADETQLLYSLCLHGRGELGLAPDEYAALTMILLRLLAFKPAGLLAARQEKKTLIDASSADGVAALVAEPSVTSAATQSDAAPASAVPPGRVLSVHSSGPSRQPAGIDIQVNRAPTPQHVVAVPVRVLGNAREEVPTQAAARDVLVPTEDGDFWHATVQQLVQAQHVVALARELALQSQLVGRDTDQWILRVERESLQQPGSRERLAAALQAIGHAVNVMVEIGPVTDSPARRNAAAAAERQLAAEKLIFEDPFVQSMLRDFGAKIVAGSIRPL